MWARRHSYYREFVSELGVDSKRLGELMYVFLAAYIASRRAMPLGDLPALQAIVEHPLPVFAAQRSLADYVAVLRLHEVDKEEDVLAGKFRRCFQLLKTAYPHHWGIPLLIVNVLLATRLGTLPGVLSWIVRFDMESR